MTLYIKGGWLMCRTPSGLCEALLWLDEGLVDYLIMVEESLRKTS